MSEYNYWNWNVFYDIPYAKIVYHINDNGKNYVACMHHNNLWEVFSDDGQIGLNYYRRTDALNACVRSIGENNNKNIHIWTTTYDTILRKMRSNAIDCLTGNNILTR